MERTGSMRSESKQSYAAQVSYPSGRSEVKLTDLYHLQHLVAICLDHLKSAGFPAGLGYFSAQTCPHPPAVGSIHPGPQCGLSSGTSVADTAWSHSFLFVPTIVIVKPLFAYRFFLLPLSLINSFSLLIDSFSL